jgi:WhiB family redox-sensing transcriptional regulator
MATQWRIDQADRKPAAPTSSAPFSDDALLHRYIVTPEVVDAECRAAALWVADYFAKSHGCDANPKTGKRCTKRRAHATAVAECREWLDILGLADDGDDTEPETQEPPETEEPDKPGLPISRDVSWMSRAACRSADVNVFFPHPTDALGVMAAKGICARCPVRQRCGDYFAPYGAAQSGIAGGMTETERKNRRRTMKRAAAREVA